MNAAMRRSWVGLALVLLLIVAPSVYADEAPAPAKAAAARPNFVVIFADDLGYGDLGCYGHPTIRTPRLDRMAAEGLRATQCYVAACVCTPSRAALLTGRLPIRSGMAGRDARVLFPNHTTGLPDSEITLAEQLRTAGYATACVGKWHLGHLPEHLPLRHGFDSYFGIPYSNDMSPATSVYARARKFPDCPLIRDEKTIENEPDQSQLTVRYTDEALEFIRRCQKHEGGPQPFFLYLAHTMPHVPLAAAAPFAGQSPRGLYGDVVETIDYSVGQILDELRTLGIADNTLVVFSSDNGPWLTQGAHGGSAGLLREGKGSTWEGGMRVPGLFYWPTRIAPGSVSAELVSLMDLWPTFSALAGASAPEGLVLDGYDLTATLCEGKPSPRSVVHYYRGVDLFALRKGPWKIHFQTQAGYNEPKPTLQDPPLLFHLDNDPSEARNLAGKHPNVVADLVAEAERHRQSTQAGEAQY